MNIQRYKWPVIVAAGLHGALFMGTPDASIVRDKPVAATPVYLPPIPDEKNIQVAEPDPGESAGDVPDAGGAVVPALPDPVVAISEKVNFPILVIDHPRSEIHDISLKEFRGGPGGSGVGLGTYSPNSIVISTKLDRQPRATAQISPEYPATMRQLGIAGSVMVEFDVNAEGRVVRAEVVRSTRREFDESALRAVRRWQFEPGRRNGRVVPFRMTVPIEFGLGD